jgi:hypothetical protein
MIFLFRENLEIKKTTYPEGITWSGWYHHHPHLGLGDAGGRRLFAADVVRLDAAVACLCVSDLHRDLRANRWTVVTLLLHRVPPFLRFQFRISVSTLKHKSFTVHKYSIFYKNYRQYNMCG